MQPDTIFLRFADRATAIAALQAAGVTIPVDEAGVAQIPADGWAGDIYFNLDVVFGTGVVFKPTGETATDAMGDVVPVMAQRPGYHINLLWRGDTLPPPIAAAVITPEPGTPAVTFG